MATLSTRLLMTTVVAFGISGVSACSGGPAPGVPMPSGKQEPGVAHQEPGAGGQEPGVSGQEPGVSGQEPGVTGSEPTGGSGSGSGGGSSSGSISGGSSSCLVCEVYSCEESSNGQSTTALEALYPSSNEACASAAHNAVLACDGTVVTASGNNKGSVLGTWQAASGGGFTASVNGATLVCTPLSSSGSSSGTVGGTPGASPDAG